ncbi:glycine zipper domain-containing protein [Alicyclobacillus macrosporangiidus]|uniref:glycine zipper domain-containing protein n=1 Tax=Alicyclobacillus macrosporangiidus TaxID=392015 RepID=UPI0026F27BBC|nr:glycine zipper domain-containing protein [Alicyclobacillus macrosporangiidus]
MRFEQVRENMFKGGSLWAGLIAGSVAQLQDTVALTNGKMRADDFAVSSTKNVTMALGTMAGVECGAILGTAVMPGFGTMLGSIIGGVVGDRLGHYVGLQAGNLLFKGPGRQA